MSDVFSDIELEAVLILENVYPRIYIMGLRKPDIIYDEDYYLLERYELDKTDTEQMEALANALTYQSVLFYMNESVYMSASIWMSEWDLMVEPIYYDIEDRFEHGVQYIIDTDTDVDRYIYVYRIMIYHAGIEYSSSYVAGVQYIDFVPSEALVNEPPIFASTGEGTLYREDSNGKIVLKGLPGQLMNPRYRGPIEYDKEWARRVSISNSVNYVSTVLKDVEALLEESWGSLETNTFSVVNEYRGKQ